MTGDIHCGCIEERCVCVLPKAHDGPHECNCGGSWGIVDDVFVIVAMPIEDGAYPEGRTAAGLGKDAVVEMLYPRGAIV